MTNFKQKIIIINFFLFALVSNSLAIKNNIFEGTIQIVETNLMDTIYYDFQVKENLASIWMHDKHAEINKRYIANLSLNELYQINNEKKVYIRYSMDNPKPQAQERNSLQIKKTNNYKFINGVKCYQWLVINKLKNTTISYWIAKEQFAYLFNIILNLQKYNKRATYFMFIPDYHQFFPYESVERGLLREFRSQDQLVSVKKNQISDKIFTIPKDYIEVK